LGDLQQWRVKAKFIYLFSSHLLVVFLALTFAPEVVKTVDVEEFTVEEWNLICLCRLIPLAQVSINNNSKLCPTMMGS